MPALLILLVGVLTCLVVILTVVLVLVLLALVLYVWITSLGIKRRCYSRIGVLRTRRLDNGKRQLLRPLVVRVTVGNDLRTIVIPAGFDTDYSSIPVWLHWFVRWSKVDMAGVIHDWLYRSGGMDRREADLIWRDVALTGAQRASRFQAQGCYLVGLRLGACLSWCIYRCKYR